MPCYKINTAPAGYGQIGTTGYATEADCLEACKEGACCNGTTCSVKPQCQCDSSQGFGFQGVGTTCSPNPCNIGACCVGPTCYQRSEEQCAAGFNVGSFFNPQIVSGGFVGDNVPCDPNPCCPTCDPYVVNQLTGLYTGTCCRAVYMDDGNGACCPTGCCPDRIRLESGQLVSVAYGGSPSDINGSCCVDSKPYCCTYFTGAEYRRQCQAYPPAAFAGAYLSACAEPALKAMTATLPSEPFTLQVAGTPGRAGFSNNTDFFSTAYDVRFQMGDVDETFSVGFEGTTRRSYCKPPSITTATVTVSNLQYGPNWLASGFPLFECWRPDESSAHPAWLVGLTLTNPCDCNPLP